MWFASSSSLEKRRFGLGLPEELEKTDQEYRMLSFSASIELTREQGSFSSVD